MNSITLIGRVGKDPQIHNTEKTTIASFSIATSDYYGGEKQTTWHNCKAFGKTAEVIEKYAKKGMKIGVQGMMTFPTWEDKEGVKKYGNEVIVGRIELLSGKDETEKEVEDDLPW